MQIAVIGGGECSLEVSKMAEMLGILIAERGHILICGGRTGVMEAASRGVKEAGGLTVGILPGDLGDGNPFLDVIIATGMAHARNAIIVRSCDAVIALPGGYGTLSEIALALKLGRRVISFQSWDVPGTIHANTAEEAVEKAEEGLGEHSPS
jgi:uncharacterized protein (TIGR00725 family)